jgi:hypothetical protein
MYVTNSIGSDHDVVILSSLFVLLVQSVLVNYGCFGVVLATNNSYSVDGSIKIMGLPTL